MKKTLGYIEKWETRRGDRVTYWVHKLFHNGNISDPNKYKTRSGQWRKIKRWKLLEPGKWIERKKP